MAARKCPPPQGTGQGLLQFLVLINNVGFPNKTQDLGEVITCKKRVSRMNEIHLK